jgi:ribose transport system ATP-binding protein
VTPQPVVEFKRITKTFPGVVALKNADLVVYPNEILGLVGENGAGKSTMMKILVGVHRPDSGEMKLRGREFILSDPAEAGKNGIGMVFQEGNMIPNLTVAENIFLAHEEQFMRMGFLQRAKMETEARKILDRVGVGLNPNAILQSLPPASQLMVEISRLLWLSGHYGIENPVLILDEPTTVLMDDEIKRLFEIFQEIKKSASIIFISHRLEEIISESDRIVVFKDGEFVKELDAGSTKISEIEKLMVGKELADDHFRESEQTEPDEDVILAINDLRVDGSFEPTSFSVRRGEIVSLVGLIGSGKEEVCACLTGSLKPDGGTIVVDGKKLTMNSPMDSVLAGIGHVPKERRSAGLALDMSVMDNINMLVLPKLKRMGAINRRMERENAQKWIRDGRIKTPSLNSNSANLSGGNQQKVIISKWLSSAVHILILDHPTRGVDVGAKGEIYERIRRLAKSGMSLLIMCDTLEEDIGLSNRMVIMKDGQVTKEIDCPAESKPSPMDLIDAIV